MAKQRIVSVLGTRPEIIKCSPLLPEFDRRYNHVLIHTGQHYDDRMDEWFFRDLGLRAPDFNLNVGSGSHGVQLARMLTGIEPILQEFEPDIVFVQGDTNSTLAGAMAAAKLGMRVVHLEAGCRSFNRAMPEEINRVIVDHVAALCLAPDDAACAHLAAEGIAPELVRMVGSTGVDACLRVAGRADQVADSPDADLPEGGFLVATIHRAENTNPETLAGLIAALADLARDWPVVFPVHPRTVRALDAIGRRPGIRYLDPVGYPQMIRMVRRSRALLTDSGGLQEESAVLGTPTFILRNETEWSAFVEAGQHRLVGTDPRRITSTVRAVLTGGPDETRMRTASGMERAGATQRVLAALNEVFGTGGEDMTWNRPGSASRAGSPGDASAVSVPVHAHEKAAHQ